MTFDIILVGDSSHPDESAGFLWARSYGTHRLASHLRSHGYTVLVIDFCSALTFEHWEEICNHSVGDNTQMIGFSTTWWPMRDKRGDGSMTRFNQHRRGMKDPNNFMYNVVNKTFNHWIEVAKKKNKKLKIIVGGPKIDHYLDFPADHFVLGLGENQVIDLLQDKRRIWPPVVQHDTKSNNRDWGWNTSSTSYTEYDFIQSHEVFSLEIARGCRFNCSFCSYPLIGMKDVAAAWKTEETIYNELMDNYNKWGVTQYTIVDDTFNDETAKVEMMVRVVKRLPFKPKFWAYIRLDMFATRPEQIELLKEMGLCWAYIGIETFHPVASKAIGKGMPADKRKELLNQLNNSWQGDVIIDASYIIGLPGEDLDFLVEQFEWLMGKDSPINRHIAIYPLYTIDKDLFKYIKYTNMSKIDKDPASFGYTYPDSSKPTYWAKDDNTGIPNFETAYALAVKWQKIIDWNKRKLNRNNFNWKNIDPLDDYFNPLIQKLKSSS